MTSCQQVGKPIVQCLRQSQLGWGCPASRPGPAAAAAAAAAATSGFRAFSGSARRRDDVDTVTTAAAAAEKQPPPPKDGAAGSGSPEVSNMEALLDRNTTTLRWAEMELMKKGSFPVGSRRRRAALRTSPNIPFEQLPYQCFQEARKILQEDRADKLRQLAAEAEKIRNLEATPADKVRGGEQMKQTRLNSLRRYVEELKILADINDPLVKRRFEDGMGDMNKPIYRHLAERKWRSFAHKITAQRIEQFHIVPDVLPKFEPTMAVDLYFRKYKVSPGEIVDSAVSEVCPRLRVQYFDKEPRLATVVVMDSDVPDPESDAFARRCHYLAANIPLGPTTTSLPLSPPNMTGDLVVPWLPAYSQKGSPYHRLSVFVLLQKEGEPALDTAKLRELYEGRDGFSLKSFRDKFSLTPAGFNIFRTIWDPNTALVMARHSIPGADIEFKHVRVESLKPARRARGWEARRQKPKYRSLWKYTKRIA